jgi:hypothetical protein
VKHSRLAHMAVVQRKARAAEALDLKAHRIAQALTPRVTEGHQYPLETRDDSLFGSGSIVTLNAKPLREVVVWQRPLLASFRLAEASPYEHVSQFRMRAIIYEMQRDQTRVRWYGWGPAEDVPSAEVRTCLHQSLAHMAELEGAVRALFSALRSAGLLNDRISATVGESILHLEGLKADIMDALGASTQLWEAGKRVGTAGGP